MNYSKLVGNRIRAARQYRGVTTNKAAEDVGWNVSAFSVYERAKSVPPIEKLGVIAEYLKVPMEYFFVSDDRAEAILYGTEVRSDEKIADLEEQLAFEKECYEMSENELEKAKKKLSEAGEETAKQTAEIDRLNKQINTMKVELEHYRNEPVMPTDWQTLKETAIKSIQASRAILEAASVIMEQSV